ncbi:hypothetical protein AQUCO_00300422v1 [Aquilegia coerulea]|uniref:Uncharacterized protein n=1 Tax=Aquilegia coerulea TaxID=218851 RepID=A0A2G5EYT5_AQUCA|nr:hypothetical protein AQUCO_00300422v1 [Aquilegia coerulea]
MIFHVFTVFVGIYLIIFDYVWFNKYMDREAPPQLPPPPQPPQHFYGRAAENTSIGIKHLKEIVIFSCFFFFFCFIIN